MIAEKDLVTKKYLKSQLDPIYKEFGILRAEMKEQKVEIIREMRIMMHETMEIALENAKLFYRAKNDRHVGVVIEGMKDDNRGIADGIKMLEGRVDGHEVRLDRAGL